MRASALRPSGEWNDDDFDVLANGAVSKVHAAPVGTPWMWSLAFGQHEESLRISAQIDSTPFSCSAQRRTEMATW
jgi:hypothetical protein